MTLRNERWLFLLPAVGILALFLFTQRYEVAPGLEKNVTALVGCLALACFARGGRLAALPAVPLWRSILWSLVGAAIPFLAAEFVMQGSWAFLGSLCGEVFLPMACLLLPGWGVLAFLQRSGKGRAQKQTLWHIWLFWLAAVYFGVMAAGRAWLWNIAELWFWRPLALIGLPFWLPWLCRALKKRCPGARLPAAVLYFLLSALFYGWSTGIFLGFLHGMSVADPVVGLYQIVLCILVFRLENKADPMVSRPAAAVLAAVYGLGCAGMALGASERLREIVFHLGGPALGISETVRQDWLGYHATAALSFLTGDLGRMDAAFGERQNNYYQWLFYADNPLFPRLVWILAAMVVLAVAELVLLARSRPGSPPLERCKKYLILGISLRLAAAVLCKVGMFGNFAVDFPFTGAAVLDFLFLWVYLRALRQNRAG